MKRNKMRFAAVALSAILAAGMLPVGAFAEELSAGDEMYEVIEDAGVGYVVDESSMEWDFDQMKVTYTLNDPEFQEERTEDCVVDEKSYVAPTCTTDGYRRIMAYIEGNWYHSPADDERSVLPKFNHMKDGKSAFEEFERVVDVFPTCEEEGRGRIKYKCSICGEIDDEEIPWVLEKTGHKFGEVKTRNELVEDGNVIELEDGSLALEDETMDGYYYEVTYRECTNVDRNTGEPCPERVEEKELKVIYSQKVTSAMITDKKKIASDIVGMTMEEFRDTYPTDDDIELSKCTESGQYEVTYYNNNGLPTPTSHRWFTVAPHHMEMDPVIEFDTLDDANQCVVDEETLTVTNNSCYKTITYYEVIHCTAKGCPNKKCKTDEKGEHYTCENTGYKEVSRVTKEAAPEGPHIINTYVYDEIEAMAENGYADIATLEELAKDKGSYIRLGKNTATCVEDGTITVYFICKVCKEEVETIVLDTKALGHVSQPAIGENVTPPTCEAEGSYDAVIYCKRCGEELARREGVKIPRLKHTNEISVDEYGNGVEDTESDDGAYIVWIGDKVVEPEGNDGSYLDMVGAILADGYAGDGRSEFSVFAKLVTNCKRCGNHEVIIDDVPELEILDIQKQGMTCEFGYITLGAYYETSDGDELYDTITVPYWTNQEAYQGRTAHTALPPVEEVREDGTYIVIYCQICGTELYSKKIKDAEGKEVKDGLCLDEDGVWRYYENDEFAKEFTGIAPYNTAEFFVANGVLCSEANGLNLYDDTWYFLSEGRICSEYSGLALYDGCWFMIKDGELDETANGLYDYDGGTFLFAAGKKLEDYNGLWRDIDGTWYFLAKGQVQKQYSGVAEYDGEFFVVENGVFQNDYTGTIEYDGHVFNVVKGQLYDEVA